MNSISPNLNIMIKTAEKASKVLIRDFGELENLQVSKKGPRDFVTNSDKKVEIIILEELEKSKKNFSFLSEENGKIENTDVALKGQTVSSSYKPATLTNGVNIQVPPFIESDDEILIDTRTIEYIKKI